MRKKFLILAAVAGASSCLSVAPAGEASGAGQELPVYPVSKLAAPIAIDGNWDKPAWRPIKPLVLDNFMGAKPDHRPRTSVKLAWDANALYFIFRVEDRYVRAVTRKYQGWVCEDSCVEFFFTPGAKAGLSYFNLESNCGGTLLFWWNPEGKPHVPVAEEDGAQVEIGHSLPNSVDPEIQAPTTWTLEGRLPLAVVKKYCPDASPPAPGVTWKANFYKCGSMTSHPHYLTWSRVDSPKPEFHLPQYFGSLKFE